jgi:2-polyprenyl-6-hydroxyphenyl methylase/3-demethylubiquinone-9 3-methyltransferase
MRGTDMPDSSSITLADELAVGRSNARFAFGRNWQRFLAYLNDERIAEAEKSLRTMLEVENLHGKSFIDIGCGSGLFSLAAMRLGADRIHSFDYDIQSVACAQELKRRYFAGAHNWTIQQGSVLDLQYLSNLGQFDVVYSWGVLHHTGHMWKALENVIPLIRSKGKLFIALYNDQGVFSSCWKTVKRLYCQGFAWRLLFVPVFGAYFAGRGLIKDVLVLRKNPLRRYGHYQNSRGMAYFPDLLDWIGGYPFEVAKPDAVFDFYRKRSFELARLKTAGIGHGNNEFVFIKCAG